MLLNILIPAAIYIVFLVIFDRIHCRAFDKLKRQHAAERKQLEDFYTRKHDAAAKIWQQNFELRGTGRTTAGILQAIGTALLQPDQWVHVVDHSRPRHIGPAYRIDPVYRIDILRIAKMLGIRLNVRLDKHSIAVKSDITEVRKRQPRKDTVIPNEWLFDRLQDASANAADPNPEST